MNRLEGRVAIITGAARGLGEAAARAMCEEGAAVMMTDVLADLGEAAAQSLRDEGYRAQFLVQDVRTQQGWDEIVSATNAAFGDIHILVNNAGITFNATFEDVSLEKYQEILDINLLGPFIGMKAVLPSMKRTGNGSIINIASTTTDSIRSVAPCYGSAKAALANLTKSAALHCAEKGYGIRVNSIHPGAHATPILIGPGGHHEGMDPDADVPGIPMRRLGKPRELAKVVVFLASDDASYMTGSEVFADGGMTIL